ncbi:MAG: hypothetical protein JWO79_3863 [Actinomycetia bacterium]|nr:hypothetical protein [Actinomycetes bacterium]MDQ1659433.1 hypothetical protein [Cryptosporangiaceae bacterium]
MKRRLIMATVLAGLVTLASSATGAAARAATPVERAAVPVLTAPITGTLTTANGQTRTLAGTFTPTSFVANGDNLLARGTATTTLPVGSAARAVSVPVTLPVTQALATCDILHLTLGPLDLNLLGLTVHLDRVVLNIDAVLGGGLLGNLLCAIANLLNGGLPLSSIVSLLNEILRILG